MKFTLAVLMLFALSTPVYAETYQWTDDKGVVHFTDNPDKVPLKYRKKVRKRPSVKSERPTPVSPEQKASAPRKVEKKEAVKLYGGHDEAWWRATTGKLRQELAKLNEELPGKRDKLQFLRRRWVISMGRTPKAGEKLDDVDSYVNKSALGRSGKDREAYYAMKAEVENDEARIKEMERQLADLDLLATQAGVPREWIK